ncbi:hypothetical protein BH10BAC2_BH10BAC2_27040 [soil metagenome]
MINFDKTKEQIPSNDNGHTTNDYVLTALRNIKNGRKKDFLQLGNIYEHGHGVKQNMEAALNAYESYYENYRKLVPVKFDIIQFLIDIGNMHMKLGNKFRAAEWYLKAAMHIMELYNINESQQKRTLKKYKLEKLLIKTGYHDIV